MRPVAKRKILAFLAINISSKKSEFMILNIEFMILKMYI